MNTHARRGVLGAVEILTSKEDTLGIFKHLPHIGMLMSLGCLPLGRVYQTSLNAHTCRGVSGVVEMLTPKEGASGIFRCSPL